MVRYQRQMLLEGFGAAGQRRLSGSQAVIVGCGALGCASADLLARAGVGRITIVDRDVVETSNLQRQCLFTEADASGGIPKAEAARRRLLKINSSIQVVGVVAEFEPRTGERIAGIGSGAPADVLIDGTDNFQTRYLLNDVAVKHSIAFVYGGAVGTRGMSMTILPGRSPCLRCVFETMPPPGSSPTCDTAGVLGPVAAIVGAYEACEAIKILLGRTDLCNPGILDFDPWHGQRRRIDLRGHRRGDECPACGRGRFEFLEGAGWSRATTLCGQDAVQVLPPRVGSVLDLDSLCRRLEPFGRFRADGFMLRGELNGQGDRPYRVTVFRDGRAVIHGTDRPEQARSIYDKYIGS